MLGSTTKVFDSHGSGVKKALNVHRKKAGEFLHYGRVEEAVLDVEMTDWS